MMAYAELGCTVALAVLLAGSLVFLLLAQRATLAYFRHARPQPLPGPAPPVAILRPIEGADQGTAAAIESFLRLDYPGRVEVIVGTLREDDPVVAVVRALQSEWPDLRLILGESHGHNRKTSIMHHLALEAGSDLLVFVDGDVEAEPDYLSWVVPPLLEPEVGCVTLLPCGVDPGSLGARAVALHYGFCYLPQWIMAVRTTGIQWAIGKTMAVRREVLDAIGGVLPFADALADDYELGHRVHRLGLRVALPPYCVAAHMPQESLSQALGRLSRWARTIRRSRPAQYAGVIFTMPVAWALLLALLHPHRAWTWAILAAVLALRLALAWQLQRRVVRLDDWRRCWWLLPLVDLMEWWAFFTAYRGNTIVWRGHRYRLHPNGDLERLDHLPAEDSASQ